MAEPRKVQFVTLSAFAPGSATESRKRRIEDDEADIDLDGDGEVDSTATGAGGGSGLFGKTDDKDNAEPKRITVRLNLSLSEPSDQSSAEFNYVELIQNIQAKKNPPAQTLTPTPFSRPLTLDPKDPFNDDERERLQVEAIAKKFENKYGNTNATGQKKRKDRMQDLIDIGFGYDETDPFIDNSEAYDELVPASLTTKLGGFYINTGTLQFRAASESEGEDGGKDGQPRKLKDGEEQVIKRRKRKEGSSLEEKKPRKIRVPKAGVSSLMNIHRPEKKKRKKLMKDSLCLAAMLRRFTREKQEMRKLNPSTAHPGMGNSLTHAPRANHLPGNSSLHANAGNNEVSLAELTADPTMMSLLGSANDKELQDLLGDLDFNLLEGSANLDAATPGRENGLMGSGVSGHKVGGGLGRGLAAAGGHLHPPPLPDGLPPPLIKRIEDLRTASRQFDQEGRKKFFTLDMNNILLDIELQVQEQPMALRQHVYSHLEAFVPCNKEALLKRLKKLSLNIQDDRLRTPLMKLKLAVCSVMPEQIQRYNMDCMAKAANRQPQAVEGEKNGSEEEDEGKPGKRMMGPRKKFVWDDKLRSLLCNLVRVKLSCYELEASQCSLSVEDYLKAFMENEVKPLWPKGWMQARMLFKESRAVHSHLTGNLVKKRMVPTPRPKAKEGQWIQQRPGLPTSTTPSLPHISSNPSVIHACRPPPSPSEPICLSDSLDEDLSAPSLDSISHALAFLSQAAKGLGPHGGAASDLSITSPLSPPPLQIPNSSPPSVTPHYSSSSSLITSHSLSKANPASSATVTMSATASVMTTPSSSPSTTSSGRVPPSGATLVSRGSDGAYGSVKGAGLMGQTLRHNVGAAAHRQGGVAGGSKLHPLVSPSPPTKQRPPPTASPLLPPHQKAALGMGAGMPGLGKSSVKANSNGGAIMGSVPSPSPQSRATNSQPHPQQLNPKSSQQPSYLASSVASPTSQLPSHHQSKANPPHQSNFITPMQATLTKSSHSSNSSPIIKLTPRPPAPTPPPASSPSSSSPSHTLLSHPQMISSPLQYQSPKTPGFRPPFTVQGGAQVKPGQGSYSFAGKAPTVISSSSSNSSPLGMSPVSSRPDNSTSPSTVSTSHGQGQRQRTVGGAKAVSSRTPTATMATPPVTSHLTQVSSGSPLLGGPLGFGMLRGLVPVSLPFQFPSLLNFSPAGVPGGSGLGTGTNSGYTLAQSDLMELYKSLQSGSQAALPPHLQLAFSDTNQSQGGDMKRKSL